MQHSRDTKQNHSFILRSLTLVVHNCP
ncbi:MAG: hypothetical protein ACPG5F_02590 [Porticoccaceae bacterium]